MVFSVSCRFDLCRADLRHADLRYACPLLDIILFLAAVSAENLPGPGSQPLEKCLPLFSAEILIRIYGSHQDRRITVILCLLRGHVLQIDKDVTGEFDMRFFRPAHCEVYTENRRLRCAGGGFLLLICSEAFVSEVSDRLC